MNTLNQLLFKFKLFVLDSVSKSLVYYAMDVANKDSYIAANNMDFNKIFTNECNIVRFNNTLKDIKYLINYINEYRNTILPR